MEKFNAYGGILQNLFLFDQKEREETKKYLFSLHKLYLNARQLCDLELLINGSFSPLNGFFNEYEYTHVLSNYRLPTNLPWSIPIILDTDDVSSLKINQDISLCDEYGKPIALLTISSIYLADKKKEAESIYGTTSTEHYGVNYLFYKTGKYYIGGTVKGIDNVDRLDFVNLRYTPHELRLWFKKNKWDRIVGFQTRNPLHRAHTSLMEYAAKNHNAKILLHPTVGVTKEGDIDYLTRIKIYKKIVKKYMKSSTKLALLPLAMRMAGPKEALLHAIIRKNYGCTHFIIGRDHAGPGSINGKSLYHPYDAQKFVGNFESELGLTLVTSKEMQFVEEQNKYLPEDEISAKASIQKISGTKFRELLRNNKKIPYWFSYPETIHALKKSVKREKKKGITIFLTGLPSSGKSTIAKLLYFKLLETQQKQVTLLDGDIIRKNLSKGLGFTREDRNLNIQRIGFVANEITKHGGIAICSAIAPYNEARKNNRELISENGSYIEVYVSTPVEVCIERDVKGLYWSAKNKKIQITGLDDPYEEPNHPEITINTVGKTPMECVQKIIFYLKNRKS